MKMVIDSRRTMAMIAQSTIKRCNLKVKPRLHPFKVAWLTRLALWFPIDVRSPSRLEDVEMRSYVMSCPWIVLTFY